MSHKISAKVIAHSKSPKGEELISYELVFPRYILAEFNTHREFSRNSASSRAIPFSKNVESVMENTFIPVAWQVDHTGMQGKEYITDTEQINLNIKEWLEARDYAVKQAFYLNDRKVTKQLCNRLLEPFMYHKVIVTTSKPGLENFFNLRCPQYQGNSEIFKSRKDAYMFTCANEDSEFFNRMFPNNSSVDLLEWLKINNADGEIHISILAELMWDAYNESIPDELQEKDYHIPYSKDIKFVEITNGLSLEDRIKVSIGMCARVSYTPVGDDTTPTAKTYINIYDKMVNAEPFHASPFEHVPRVMTEEEYSRFIRGNISVYEWLSQEYREEIKGWCRNFKGFIQERHRIEELKWRG